MYAAPPPPPPQPPPSPTTTTSIQITCNSLPWVNLVFAPVEVKRGVAEVGTSQPGDFTRWTTTNESGSQSLLRYH
ncbi:hypothetical protein E2C01_047908 [Portunus trituberculatus]|uniref:Uncharacterized protein n=1 Tax=Portunus trituberculatus TaxID=210409 RepID=A0A5B7G9S4_PORTR|nr:hypothetical protein [Portunus trituberculatus]